MKMSDYFDGELTLRSHSDKLDVISDDKGVFLAVNNAIYHLCFVSITKYDRLVETLGNMCLMFEVQCAATKNDPKRMAAYVDAKKLLKELDNE